MDKKKWLIGSLVLNGVLLIVCAVLCARLVGNEERKASNEMIRTDMLFSSEYAQGDILLIGGERMQLCAWRNLIGDGRICNLSLNNTIEDEIKRAEFIFEANEPSQIILMLGMQDLKQGMSVNMVYEQFVKYVQLLKEKLPTTEIVVHSLMPVGPDRYNDYKDIPLESIESYNTFIKMYALQEGMVYLNMYDEFHEGAGLVPVYNTGDGYHLTPIGYRQWKARLVSVLPSKE